MRTIYKYILCMLFGTIAISQHSCTDLNETIYSTIATEQYTFSAKDAASLFSPVYSSLRDVYWGWNGYCDIQDESSDLWCTPYRVGIGWGDLYVAMHKHQFNSEIGHIWTIWNGAYSGINACNKLLANDGVKSSQTAVSQLRGYRALYYYVLFDVFRNIPLDTTFNHPAGWLPEQSKPQETWDFITSELTSIKGKCGPDNGMGQINDYTTNMLLAKMYLNHNAWFNDFSDNSWYGKAIDEVNEVVKASKFSLATSYSDCFKEDISKCSEIIFGIPFAEKYASGNYYAKKCISSSCRAAFNFNVWSTGGSTVLPQFLDTYDKDDARYTSCWTLGQQYSASTGEAHMSEGSPVSYTKEIHSIDNPG